jgi:hypothetical protein
MRRIAKWSTPLLAGFFLVSLGLATTAMAKSLRAITTNETNKRWNVKECVNSKECKSFTLGKAAVSKLIPEPSSGTAAFTAFFMEISTPSVQIGCEKDYNVNTSSVVYVNVVQSSASFNCSIIVP